MYPNKAAREMGVLLRISQELDIIGDVTSIVANPSELLAWTGCLDEPKVVAWQAGGRRYVQVTALHEREPVRGRVAAVLHCEAHPEFWCSLIEGSDSADGFQAELTPVDLSRAWEAMPITPPA